MLKVITAIALILVWLGLSDVNAKSYDEIKQERLAKQRAERRATEIKYETCLHSCRKQCGGWE